MEEEVEEFDLIAEYPANLSCDSEFTIESITENEIRVVIEGHLIAGKNSSFDLLRDGL
jgi:hypothetical protein